jgi:glutamate synthase domain-containing protein 3
MDKEMLDIRMVDLLEQIQEVDKLIQLYVSKTHDVIAMSMLKQYTIRREEFVQQLNEVFSQFSLQLTAVEPMNVSKKSYTSEKLVYSLANEPVSTYKNQEGLTEIDDN